MDYYDFYDPYDYSSPYMETTLIGIMMIFAIVMLVCGIFALISYILRGVGMYTMAKRQGMDYAWLAFIPFARTYLHGELAGSIRLKNKSIQNPGIWLLAFPFLYAAVSSLLNGILWFIGVGSITKAIQYAFLPYGRMDIGAGSIMGMVILFIITAVVSVAYTALYKTFEVLVDHQILERFTSKNMSIVHAVLSTFIPMYESICFFVMRNRPFNPGMEPPAPQPFMQSPPPGGYYGMPVPPPEPPYPSAPAEPPYSTVSAEPPITPAPPVQPMGGTYYGDAAGATQVQNTLENGMQGFGSNENAGNSGSTGSLGNIGSIGSILDAPEEKTEDSSNDGITSSVNFTLLDDDHTDKES